MIACTRTHGRSSVRLLQDLFQAYRPRENVDGKYPYRNTAAVYFDCVIAGCEWNINAKNGSSGYCPSDARAIEGKYSHGRSQ